MDFTHQDLVLLPARVYDMDVRQLLDSDSCVDMTSKAQHDGKTKRVQVFLTPVFDITYKTLAKKLGISKSCMLSCCVKLGLSIWQHNCGDYHKESISARQELFDADYSACARIFGKKYPLFPQQPKGEGRFDTNIVIESESLGAIGEQVDSLGVSQSEFILVLMAISIIRFENLPSTVFDEMLHSICALSERQDEIVRECRSARKKRAGP